MHLHQEQLNSGGDECSECQVMRTNEPVLYHNHVEHTGFTRDHLFLFSQI